MFIEKGVVKVEQDTAWKVSKYGPEKTLYSDYELVKRFFTTILNYILPYLSEFSPSLNKLKLKQILYMACGAGDFVDRQVFTIQLILGTVEK